MEKLFRGQLIVRCSADEPFIYVRAEHGGA